MAEKNIVVDLLARLKQPQSEKQIKKDIKNMGDIKIPLVGTLSPKTNTQLKKDIASLKGTVDLSGKINHKDIAATAQQAAQQAQKTVNEKPVEVSFALKKEKLISEVRLLAQQNSRLLKNSDMTGKYNSLLDNADMASNTVELNTLQTQLESFRSEIQATQNAGMTMTDVLKSGFAKVLQVFGSDGIMEQFLDHLRNAWTEAKELDKSMTDLSRVNDEMARSRFPDYLDRVIDKSRQLAVAARDYIDVVTTFSKAGYNLADSETLADMAVQLEKTGDMSAADASETLLTGLQGYDEIDGFGMNRLSEKAQALNDKIGIIGNTASITYAELGRGIQVAGSAMDDANTSIDEFLALLAAGNRTIQDSDKVALAIRASALRIHGCTEELQEMGETTDDVMESASALAEKVRALTDVSGSGGVNILEADGETFRSIYDIYNDIAEVYDKMSDEDAGALLNLIAGKDGSSQISAILQNMSEADALLEKSLNAAGTVRAEYETYLNSAEAASERFGVAMTETYSSLIGGETVKGLANAGAAVLEFANSWGIVEGTLKGFLALGILKGVTTLTAAFKNSALQISSYGKALNAVNDLNNYAQGTEKYVEAMDTLKSSCANLTDEKVKQVLANRNLSDSQLLEILQLDNLEKEQQDARLAQLGLIQTTETQTAANGAATASTFSLKAAVTGLGASIKAAWMSNPVGIVIMGISAAVGLLTSGIGKLKQRQEEERQAMQETKQEYQDLAAEVTNLNEELETTRKRLEELEAVGYDNLSLVDKKEYDGLIAVNEELERELRIKEALANVKLKEVAENTRKSLEKRSEGSIENYTYGVGREKVDQIDSLNEYLNLADKQKQSLEDAQKALEDYENAYSGTAEEMLQDKSWLKLNDNIIKAESALSDTEKIISDKYEEIETESEGLVDSMGNVVSGCEEIYQRVENLKNRVDIFFNPKTEMPNEKQEIDVQSEEQNINTQTLFTQLNENRDALDKLTSSIQSAQDAYAVLLSGKYESAELLNSIQTINQAAADMNGSLNWEFISRQTDSIELLGNAMQYISQKYAESTLSDLKIDINSNFGKMFSDMIQQMYSAEATFEGMNSQLDSLQSSYRTLKGIVESYNETGDISLDNLQSLLTADENLIAMLEVENGQLAINQSAYENLVAAQLMEFKNKLNAAAAAEIEALAKSKSEEATNKNAEASDNAIAKLDAETDAFGRNTTAAIANAVAKAEESGVSEEEIQGIFDKYTEVWNTAMNNYNSDFSGFMGSGESAAQKAGSSAGDAYLDAFKKEYDRLKDMLDRGEISESQYLNDLRSLYTRYFKDRKEYLEEYQKYESEYLSGMLDLHNKALSGVSTLLNRKISAANDAKDSAISALEEEKEAAAEAYQAQIDAIEEEKDAIDEFIKEKEKKIDALNEEADAIQKAAETRKKNIDLQKEEYNLERMLNQRTTAVYKEGEGFVFETDTAGIRDARERVNESKEELEIDRLKNEADLIRKEIDLLEEKKDALTTQQEAIQKMMDESDKYYDNLIKQQEKMWDSMINGMEQQKAKWEELADIQEIAEAYTAVEQVFGELGYSVQDILNGNEQAFEDFKSRYIGILSDMNQNTSFQDGLEFASGVAKEKFESIISDAQGAAQQLSQTFSDGTFSQAITQGVSDGIVSAQQELDKMNQLGNDAGEGFVEGWKEKSTEISDATKLTAEEAVEAFAEGQDSSSPSEKYKSLAGDAIEGLLRGVEENKQLFIDAIRALSEEGLLAFEEGFVFDDSTIKTSFDSLILLIQSVCEALGYGSEDSVGGLLGALNQLSAFSFEDAGEGMITQFDSLKSAIDGVTSAINGGGGDSSGGDGSSGGESIGGKSKGGKSVRKGGKDSGGSSLTDAIQGIAETAGQVIGEPEAEGDGTVIGAFGALETAVTDVTAAIGGGEPESGKGQGKKKGKKKGKSEEDSDNLIGAVTNLGETTEETLGESGGDGVIGRFEEFNDVIGEANEQVTGIADGLAAIDGQDVACTIKITIDSDGYPVYASGTALGVMNLNSTEYHVGWKGNAHVSGTANVAGNWGVRKPGRSLVGELGQEIWVHSESGTFETVGDNGPEFINTKKGDLIFNHLQTKELLDRGNIVKTGKAYANGTIEYSDGTIIRPDGSSLRPLQEGDRGWDLMQKFQPLVDKMLKGETDIISHAMFEHQRQMEKWTSQINNANVINNIANKNVQPVVHQQFNITMPNITNSTSAEALMKDLQLISRKKLQINW